MTNIINVSEPDKQEFFDIDKNVAEVSSKTKKSVRKEKKVIDGDKLDKIFGSKTRAKLLRLFYGDPSKTYYIRELSDIIGEQVNSVRRELDNMKSIEMLAEHNVSNKIYYGLNKKFEHYEAFIQLFQKRTMALKADTIPQLTTVIETWENLLIPVRPMVNALLIMQRRRHDGLDLFVVGDDISERLSRWTKDLERRLGREINYAIMTPDDFRYRLSVRDKFLISCLNNGYSVIVDDYGIIKSEGALS